MIEVVNQKVVYTPWEAFGVEVYIKREDQIHPYISGNKYRKLKYNLKEATLKKQNTLLTFGGAFSNHIAAVACVGHEFGFKTIGVIRGEELANKKELNSTLQKAADWGMQFKFVTRADYRNKGESYFIELLKQQFGAFYLIPEGGTNDLAIKGCTEILKEKDKVFDVVTVCAGTGGTAAGIINSAQKQKVMVFPALKGEFLIQDIEQWLEGNTPWEYITAYHFGGYAKINKELITFINQFKKLTQIPLDPVYTGKMMYGLDKMIRAKYFKEGSKILAVHTGGLQGIPGMNVVLKKKNLPIIDV